MPAKNALLQIENSLRASGRLEREVLALPAFEIFISPQALDHLSFAVPLSPGPVDWAAHVAQMKDAFRARGKRPRLEFVADLHPTLAAALEVAGIRREMRAPLMALDLSALPPDPQLNAAVEYVALSPDDDAFLRRFLMRQSVAFGGEAGEGALDWLPALMEGLRRGAVLGAALQREDRLLAGAVIMIGAGIGELAGVWTDPHHRRQGLAFALCHRLLQDYAAAGYALCWLSAAEGAQRLYQKLGFVDVGVQLNYGAS